MRITVLGETFDWPDLSACFDDFTIAEQETVEERTELLWSDAVNHLLRGGAKVTHAFLYVLVRRRQPNIEWAAFDALKGSQWTVDLELLKLEPDEAEEPPDPTRALDGVGASLT